MFRWLKWYFTRYRDACAEIEHLKRLVKKDILGIEQMNMESGTCLMHLQSWLAPELARIAMGALDELKAENYVEQVLELSCTVEGALPHPDGPIRFAVEIIRPGGMTPHEARRAAEAKLAELEGKVNHG